MAFHAGRRSVFCIGLIVVVISDVNTRCIAILTGDDEDERLLDVAVKDETVDTSNTALGFVDDPRLDQLQRYIATMIDKHKLKPRATSAGESTSADPRTASSPSGYFSQTFYHGLLLPVAAVTILLQFVSQPPSTTVTPKGFGWFQFSYLSVWSVCVAADWLQGPYVFALYAAYGFSIAQIAELFVVGFGSSLIFGSFVGSFADYYGRKKCCIAYCIIYAFSCATKHFNDYSVLIFGRITGGIATSILFSGFECWLVSEHVERRKYSEELLGYMFGLMYVLMYIVAVLSSIIAEDVKNMFPFAPIYEGSNIWHGGYCVPFDMAAIMCLVGMVLIACLWDENYGYDRSDSSVGLWDSFTTAGKHLVLDGPSLLLCLIVTGFEAAMFMFIFEWTPALENDVVGTPHGVVFALFMMACMCGASISTIIGVRAQPTTKLAVAVSLAMICYGVCARVVNQAATDRSMLLTCFLSFFIFEFCVGLYFPTIGILKSEVVPERIRGMMYNLFRLPLNALVVALMLSHLSVKDCFIACTGIMAFVLLGTFFLRSLLQKSARIRRPSFFPAHRDSDTPRVEL